MRKVSACISLLAIAIAVRTGMAAEKKIASLTATGAIKLVPLSADGQPLTTNSILLWRKVTAEAADKYAWHDEKTDTWWNQVVQPSISEGLTYNELEPGTYRFTVRDGYNDKGALGIGEPVVIDSEHQTASTEVRLAAGATLRVTCADAKTGRPIPPPYLDLRTAEGEAPADWRWLADPVAGRPGEFEFHHLPDGQFRLKASRSAANPIDMQYKLVEGEIAIKIDGAQTITRELKFTSSKLTKEEIDRDWPFVVFGRVTDKDGRPVKDAVIRAHTGIGTMFPTGATTTDSDGRYRLNFAEGGLTAASGIGPAIVSASKPGMAEASLGRQGEFTLAFEEPKSGEVAEWLAKRPLLLAHTPAELDFTLAHVGTLDVHIGGEDKDDLSGKHVSVKGAAMPPGCSVIESGTTDKWGAVTFAEVPLDRDWWIEFGTHGFESIRTQPFKLPDPQRYEITLERRTDATGIESFEITSITDALNIDRTLELVGDDPLSHPPATSADQKQVREWLARIAEVNQLWLAPPPAEVDSYHYDFHLADKPAQRYEVPKDRRVPGVVFHGIAYVSAISCLTHNAENVTARKIDRSNGKVTVSYALREPAGISAGNGILDTYRGFFSLPLREGILVFDPQTFQVESHETAGVVEKYRNYVRVGENHFVPREVEVDDRGAMRFQWEFEIYEPGLWLLDHSVATSGDEKDGFVHIENLEINGAAPKRMHFE